jgi:hypothetical protein
VCHTVSDYSNVIRVGNLGHTGSDCSNVIKVGTVGQTVSDYRYDVR